ncbi:MAG: DMT family transporter [Gemmatimonadales bacterium]
MHFLLPIIISLLGGVAIGLQNPLASLMGQRIGILQGAFIIHLGGALLAGGLILAVPGGNLAAWRSVPWYALGAGALGVALVTAISFAIPRIGVAATVGLVVATQIIIAAWLDHNGLLGASVRLFDTWRFVGVVLLMVGAWLVLR